MKDKYSDDVASTLDKIANNESNKFTDFINTNEPTKATDVAISVLSLVDQRRRSEVRRDPKTILLDFELHS